MQSTKEAKHYRYPSPLATDHLCTTIMDAARPMDMPSVKEGKQTSHRTLVGAQTGESTVHKQVHSHLVSPSYTRPVLIIQPP